MILFNPTMGQRPSPVALADERPPFAFGPVRRDLVTVTHHPEPLDSIAEDGDATRSDPGPNPDLTDEIYWSGGVYGDGTDDGSFQAHDENFEACLDRLSGDPVAVPKCCDELTNDIADHLRKIQDEREREEECRQTGCDPFVLASIQATIAEEQQEVEQATKVKNQRCHTRPDT